MIEQFEEPLGPQGRLFEQELHQDLHQFLQSMKEIDVQQLPFRFTRLDDVYWHGRR